MWTFAAHDKECMEQLMEDAKAQNDSQRTTIISAGTKITGTLVFEGQTEIRGQIEGEIIGRGSLRVTPGALAKASVSCDTVLVDGQIVGDVVANDRLELSADAVVEGDLTATSLVVAEGASFSGHCRVGSTVEVDSMPEGGRSGRQAAEQARAVESKPRRAPASNGQPMPAEPDEDFIVLQEEEALAPAQPRASRRYNTVG